MEGSWPVIRGRWEIGEAFRHPVGPDVSIVLMGRVESREHLLYDLILQTQT